MSDLIMLSTNAAINLLPSPIYPALQLANFAPCHFLDPRRFCQHDAVVIEDVQELDMAD